MKNYNREEILAKSICLFRKKGYKGVSLQELLDKTDLSVKVFYRDFGDEENFLSECIDDYVRNSILTLGEILPKKTFFNF